jgi:serine/arginine repetitive matrix protein 2
MPRPMTPRDPLFDSDDQLRPHSTTPRPISPHLPGLNGHSSPMTPTSIAAGLMRRDSNASTTYSPMNLNGTFLFDDQRGSTDLTMEDALSSPIPNRRRPASPLAGPAYQPMAVSSRPGTPSNVTWNTPSNSFNSNVAKTHGRNESADSGQSGGSSNIDENPVAVVDRSNSTAGRSLRSPDPHLIDRRQLTTAPSFDWDSKPSMNRTPAVIPNIGLDTPAASANRSAHSPTPTQSRSPLSVVNDLSSNVASRRTSRQNAPSPFNFGPAHSLNFSPRANSSRSSIASAGSSYHSDDGSHKKDFDLFSDVEAQYPIWHDVSSTAKTSTMIQDESQDESEAEDIISQYAGLTKLDFVAIQEKLVGAAVAKASTPDPRERVPSLRRRRPSTSQSNYSLNGRDNKVCRLLSEDFDCMLTRIFRLPRRLHKFKRKYNRKIQFLLHMFQRMPTMLLRPTYHKIRPLLPRPL